MAKGKYKARKQNRDATQLAADLARVRDELDVEKAKLEQARGRAAVDAQLRAELTTAIAARDAVCAPQLARIAADRDVILSATRDLRSANEAIRHIGKVSKWAWEALGPEVVYAVLTGNRAFLREGVENKDLSHSATEAIQRARGIRKHRAIDYTREQKIAMGAAAAAAAGIDLPDDVNGDDDDAWDAYSKVVGADAAALLAFFVPLPWLNITPDWQHPVSRVLGAHPQTPAVTVNPVEKVPTVTDVSTGTAAMREALTAAGATAVAAEWSDGLQLDVRKAARSAIPSLVAPTSVYPSPADAAALHAWYSAVAMGAWGRLRSVTAGRVAVAAAAAVPFWLPPGHTLAYLDSEPLSDEDIDDLRLPFAQVLVTFAEPARLPPVDSGVLAEDDARMRFIDHTLVTARGSAVPDSRELLIAGTDTFTTELPTLWDVMAARGAHIEGVLLLADAHGRLDDLFGWCVAVPSTTSGTVIGRWVIPASRSATCYAESRHQRGRSRGMGGLAPAGPVPRHRGPAAAQR